MAICGSRPWHGKLANAVVRKLVIPADTLLFYKRNRSPEAPCPKTDNLIQGVANGSSDTWPLRLFQNLRAPGL